MFFQPIFTTIQTLAETLIGPHRQIVSMEAKRKARITTAMIAVMMLGSTLSFFVANLDSTQRLIQWSIILLLSGLYLFSRTRHFALAGKLAISLFLAKYLLVINYLNQAGKPDQLVENLLLMTVSIVLATQVMRLPGMALVVSANYLILAYADWSFAEADVSLLWATTTTVIVLVFFIEREVRAYRHQLQNQHDQLSANEYRFQKISSMISDAAYAIEANEQQLEIVWALGEHMMGYELHDFIINMRQYLHPDDVALYDHNLQRAMQGQRVDSTYRIYHQDGSLRWLHSSGMREDHPTKPGLYIYYGALVDITEQQLLERNRHDLLLAQDRITVLQRFTHSAAHDLRTPISIMHTSLYLLGKALEDDSGQQKRIDQINRQVQRISAMMEKLISLTSGDYAGLSLEPVDLNALVRGVVTDSSAANEVSSERLRLALEHDLGMVPLNRREFVFVIRELIINALSYAAPRSQITVKTCRDADAALFCVHNWGTMISPGELDLIFEPFYRIGERDISKGGLGVGLTIVNNIVQAHQGKIRVSSTPEDGTEFRVSVPLKDARVDPFPLSRENAAN